MTTAGSRLLKGNLAALRAAVRERVTIPPGFRKLPSKLLPLSGGEPLQSQRQGPATEASSSARACSTAARMAPRSTGWPVTPVGTTWG